ncbi:MAG: hypothetical protein L3J67_00885 [Hyphomicrobiaceae bacterium]|nr:hypothetical protein [Hyphomicrobiaceae bacterium]
MPDTENYEYQVDGHQFRFLLEEAYDGEVRIYIKDQPDYGYRDTDLHSTHRLGSTDNHYVCVHEDHVPTNFADAKDWARYWARGTAQYIDTGDSFS